MTDEQHQDLIDHLTTARDYLSKWGWTRGSYIAANGCACLSGALRIAGLNHGAAEAVTDDYERHRFASAAPSYFDRLFREVAKTIKGEVPISLYWAETTIIDWNDNNRDPAAAIDILDRTIARVIAEGEKEFTNASA